MSAAADPAVPPAPARGGRARRSGGFWSALAAAEVLLAAGAVLLDVFLPTLVVLALMTLSLLARRDGLATVGFHRLPRPGRTTAVILGLTIGWTALHLALVLPVLEHLLGRTQDDSGFAGLRGDPARLLLLLVLSWTLAAVGEEVAFRGYLPTRITDLLGTGRLAVAVAVTASSVLFGLIHTEEGVVGVIATSLDGVFFSVLRLRYRSLWASVLAHGFFNTIGFAGFFLVGSVGALW